MQFLFCKNTKKCNIYPLGGFLQKIAKPPNDYTSRWGVAGGIFTKKNFAKSPSTALRAIGVFWARLAQTDQPSEPCQARVRVWHGPSGLGPPNGRPGADPLESRTRSEFGLGPHWVGLCPCGLLGRAGLIDTPTYVVVVFLFYI